MVRVLGWIAVGLGGLVTLVSGLTLVTGAMVTGPPVTLVLLAVGLIVTSGGIVNVAHDVPRQRKRRRDAEELHLIRR